MTLADVIAADAAKPTSLLSTRDVARRLNLAERTVRHYAHTGLLPALRLGGVIRFDPRDVDAALEQARTRGGLTRPRRSGPASAAGSPHKHGGAL
jgi:excisionase family DNA binding protein